MSYSPATRKRGEAKARVTLLAKIDPAIKAKVERVAAAVGISQAAATELLLRDAVVDANGRPASYTGPLVGDDNQELPFAASA